MCASRTSCSVDLSFPLSPPIAPPAPGPHTRGRPRARRHARAQRRQTGCREEGDAPVGGEGRTTACTRLHLTCAARASALPARRRARSTTARGSTPRAARASRPCGTWSGCTAASPRRGAAPARGSRWSVQCAAASWPRGGRPRGCGGERRWQTTHCEAAGPACRTLSTPSLSPPASSNAHLQTVARRLSVVAYSGCDAPKYARSRSAACARWSPAASRSDRPPERAARARPKSSAEA